LGDDGEMDEKEKAWDGECEESENDVAGLSLSFLTAQVLRFMIGGHLPDEEGKEEHKYGFHHSGWHCKLLLGWGFVFLLGLMIVLRKRGNLAEEVEEIKKERVLSKKEEEEAEERFKEDEGAIRPLCIMNVYFSCGMAWCFFYGGYWTIAATGWTDQDAMLQVIIAIFISGISFSVIWGFDKLEDSGVLGSEADKAILAIIDALGILIGFSWEQSFDVAVDVISEDVDKYVPKTLARLVMSFALTAIVFPAWKMYILPQELELRDEATGLGKRRKWFRDKLENHHKAFEGLVWSNEGKYKECEFAEQELDHAHLAMKLHRRHHNAYFSGKSGKGLLPVKEGEKPLKHMVLTAKGFIDVPESDDALLEKLLPTHLQEPEEEEEESRWSIAFSKVRSMFGKGASDEAKEEAVVAAFAAKAKEAKEGA